MGRRKRINLADSIIEQITRLISNATVKDYVYVSSYLAAVYVAYQTVTGVKIGLSEFSTWILNKGLDLAKARGINTSGSFGSPEITPDLDTYSLALSMVAAYMVLKIDVSDVVDAVGQLTSKLALMKAAA